METPLDFVVSQKWEYRIQGNQINIKKCPICGLDDWKFFMNKKSGLWDCKHLNHHTEDNYKGNLYTLKKLLGLTADVLSVSSSGGKIKFLGEEYEELVSKAHKTLIENEYLLEILTTEWLIEEKWVRFFKLGYYESKNKPPALVIPYFLTINGERKLVDIKFRSWFGELKQFWRVKEASKILYREDYLYDKEKIKSVIVCEGEKDCVAMMTCGFKNAIAISFGAGNLLPRWKKLFDKVETIYLALDNDEAGRKGVDKFIDALGSYKLKLIDIPEGKDVFDVKKEKGKDYIKRIVENASEIKRADVFDAFDLVEQEEKPQKVYSLPLPFLTKVLNGGFSPGQLITLTGVPKSGKTTLSLFITAYMVLQHKLPSLFYCMEMKAEIIGSMFASMVFGLNRNYASKFSIFNLGLKQLPIHFGFKGSLTTEQLINTFKDCVYRYGTKFIVFDNIHYMVRKLAGSKQSKTEALEDLYKELKVFAIDYDVMLLVLAQPKKLNLKQASSMNYYDIGWTSAAASDSDTVMIIHRDRSEAEDKSFKREGVIKVDAGRFTVGGKVKFRFIENKMLFVEECLEKENKEKEEASTTGLLDTASC